MTVPPDRVPHNAVSRDSAVLTLSANHIAYLQTFIIQFKLRNQIPARYYYLVVIFDAEVGCNHYLATARVN